MAFPTKPGTVVDKVKFNGYTYRRYPNAKSSTHRRYYTRTGGYSLHRAVWESVHGPIPEGWHVHHKDKNFLNNSIENLECLPPSEHSAEHFEDRSKRGRAEQQLAHLAAIRDKTKEWHRSEEGREWHRQHAQRSLAKTWSAPKTLKEYSHKCQTCGGEFVANSQLARFCSRLCWNVHHNNEQRIKKKELRGTLQCKQCAITYPLQRTNQIFCCVQCKTKFNNAKKRTRLQSDG